MCHHRWSDWSLRSSFQLLLIYLLFVGSVWIHKSLLIGSHHCFRFLLHGSWTIRLCLAPVFVSWSDESGLLRFWPPVVGSQGGLLRRSDSIILRRPLILLRGLQQILEEPSYGCSILSFGIFAAVLDICFIMLLQDVQLWSFSAIFRPPGDISGSPGDDRPSKRPKRRHLCTGSSGCAATCKGTKAGPSLQPDLIAESFKKYFIKRVHIKADPHHLRFLEPSGETSYIAPRACSADLARHSNRNQKKSERLLAS